MVMTIIDWIIISALTLTLTYFVGREVAGPLPWFEPKSNTKRIKNKFVLFPIRDNEGNRYWLERVRIEEHYWDGYLGGGLGEHSLAGWQIDKVMRVDDICENNNHVAIGDMVKREPCKTYRWSQEKIVYKKLKELTHKEK